MRTTLPAAAIVVMLVLAVQIFVDEGRVRSDVRRVEEARIARLASRAAQPTSRPTTQRSAGSEPVTTDHR
jgi:hypothetical protein